MGQGGVLRRERTAIRPSVKGQPHRAKNRIRTSSELRRDVARHRGAAHPLCFTDEVMEHQFAEGFKPMNIESYDGTTDPAVWIEDFLLHIHMARSDDLHAITSP